MHATLQICYIYVQSGVSGKTEYLKQTYIYVYIDPETISVGTTEVGLLPVSGAHPIGTRTGVRDVRVSDVPGAGNSRRKFLQFFTPFDAKIPRAAEPLESFNFKLKPHSGAYDVYPYRGIATQPL